MVRIVVLSFAAVLFCGNAIAQKSRSYSSFKTRSAQGGVSHLLEKAEALKKQSPGEALDLVQEALGISIVNQDGANEAKCYLLLGTINEDISEWKLAEENYLQAHEKLANLPVTKRDPYTGAKRAALEGLGLTSIKLKNYDKAIVWYQQALTLAFEIKELTEIKLNLSEAHYLMGAYAEALKDIENTGFEKVVSLDASDPRIENQRTKIYARMEAPNNAKQLYSNSINSLHTKQPVSKAQQQSLQDTKDELVDIFRQQKRPLEEIQLRDNSIEFNTVTNNMNEVARDKVELGKTFDSFGKTSKALTELESAAGIADTLADPITQSKAYLALAKLYEKTGRSAKALNMYNKYASAIAKKDAAQQSQLLEKADLIRQQRDIEVVTKQVAVGQREDAIAKALLFRQKLIIYGLLLIIIIIAVTSYFIYKSARASKRANQLLALKSLRSQMNPHFIFNSLNSVNHFITSQDERAANLFIADLSRLMRLVMENSQEDFIPLSKEIEILSLYLRLEHYRFRDKFSYVIETDSKIAVDTLMIPPMLIQPYVENAVWHGLRYRDTPGELKLLIRQHENKIVVEVTDNGIGRRKSASLKTDNQKQHNSTALKNIEERIGIINKVYNTGYSVLISDLDEQHGTHVQISIPVRTI